MIKKELFTFLEELKHNNHRDWFHAHKKEYQSVKQNVVDFLEVIIPELEKIDSEMVNLEPKKCLFRINRDIRFSKDKSPYKTNFGSFMVKGGKSSGNAGYYIHLEPGNCFIAGGIHMPQSPELKKVRQEIYYHVEEFKSILKKALDTGNYREFAGDKLKRPPKGFPAEFPDIDLLKHKSYGILQNIPDEVCYREDFVDFVLSVFKEMSPMVKFVNRGLAM